MPDEKGRLTPTEKQSVTSWIHKYSKGRGLICPVCESKIWQIANHLLQPSTLTGGMNLALGGLGYPAVQLVSVPCGYTVTFNAVVLGLAPKEPS
jgi:hypothetical protein